MSSSADTTAEDLEQGLISALQRECRMAEYRASEGEHDGIVEKTFSEMIEEHDQDLRTGTKPRSVLYDLRLELAEMEPPLYFDAIHATGLKWTSNDVVGLKWYLDLMYAVIKAYRQKAKDLTERALQNTADEDLKEALRYLAEKQRRDYASVIGGQRDVENIYLDLQRNADIPPLSANGDRERYQGPGEEDHEALKCQDCGEIWVRPIKRGRKPKTCPEC